MAVSDMNATLPTLSNPKNQTLSLTSSSFAAKFASVTRNESANASLFAIILDNAVELNGVPPARLRARLDKAIELYERDLIVSSGSYEKLNTRTKLSKGSGSRSEPPAVAGGLQA